MYVRVKWSAPSEINRHILAVPVSGEWMAGTLQHYLMSCFYFSHVSLAERSLKITAQLIDSSMVLIFLGQLMHWQVQHCRIISDLCNPTRATKGLITTHESPKMTMC